MHRRHVPGLGRHPVLIPGGVEPAARHLANVFG